jgi:GT2 family glycosyltransferase
LRDCVGSVLAQSGVKVRVLIIDDCSPDDTATVGGQLAAGDSWVTFRRHEVNRGHIATYNEGLLEWARATYTLLLSADDMLTPGALMRATRLMELHPEVGFAYGRAIATDKPSFTDQGADPTDYRQRVLSGAEFWSISCATATNLVATPTLVVRTALQQSLGGYRTDLPHTGDLEMVLRFAAHSSVGVIDCDQAFYRVHGNNMHKATFTSAFTVLQQHKLAFDILFEEREGRIAEPTRMRDLAMRGTAVAAVKKARRLLDQGEVAACDALVAAAVEVSPDVRRSREFRRLRLARVIGRRAIGALEWAARLARPRPGVVQDISPFGQSGIFRGV